MGSQGVSQGQGQGLWFNERDQGKDAVVSCGGGDGGGGGAMGIEEGRRVDLIKAKPRPLAPFLIFLNNGGSGSGSGHLVCALGTSTGLLNTAVVPTSIQSNIPVKTTAPSQTSQSYIPVKITAPSSENDRAQSGNYSMMESLGDKSVVGTESGLGKETRQQPSPFSSPTSITNSLRYMSPHHHHYHLGCPRDDTTASTANDPPAITTTLPTVSTTTTTTTSTTASRVGLAHAIPRTSILLGGSLFEGLNSLVKITAPRQTTQSK